MVVLAQLVEHRIVVPSVVGSSPTFHPTLIINELQHLTRNRSRIGQLGLTILYDFLIF